MANLDDHFTIVTSELHCKLIPKTEPNYKNNTKYQKSTNQVQKFPRPISCLFSAICWQKAGITSISVFKLCRVSFSLFCWECSQWLTEMNHLSLVSTENPDGCSWFSRFGGCFAPRCLCKRSSKLNSFAGWHLGNQFTVRCAHMITRTCEMVMAQFQRLALCLESFTRIWWTRNSLAMWVLCHVLSVVLMRFC